MSSNLHYHVSSALMTYEMPVEASGDKEKLSTFTIGTLGGRSLLSDVFPSFQRRKSFPFFKLPSELRNDIYTLVFQYPRSSLLLRPGRFSASVASRCLNEGPVTNAPNYPRVPRGRDLLTKDIHHILAPLLASKQFHDEAMPLFYSINHFVFQTHQKMSTSLSGMAPRCRKHLRIVTFRYDTGRVAGIVAAINLLAGLEGLRALTVCVDEEHCTRRHAKDDSISHVRVESIPGYAALMKIKGLDEVVFVGCPTLESKLKAGMLEPRAPKKDRSAGGKKRKATSTAPEQGTGGTRAKKAKAA